MGEPLNLSTTPEQWEQWAFDRLPEWFEKLDGLFARMNALSVQPGSVAEMNNEATPFDPISNQVSHFLAAAYDHLSMCRQFVEEFGLPAYAWHSLIRASIEASALGLWLITPGPLNKRVFRSVQWVWNNRLTADEFTKRSGANTPETTEWVHGELERIKNKVKGNTQRSLDRTFPTTTAIIIEAERVVRIPAGMNGVDVWSACSAFAHGNRTFALATLKYNQVELADGTGRAFEVRGNWGNFAMMFNVALSYFEALISQSERINTTPRSGLRAVDQARTRS